MHMELKKQILIIVLVLTTITTNAQKDIPFYNRVHFYGGLTFDGSNTITSITDSSWVPIYSKNSAQLQGKDTNYIFNKLTMLGVLVYKGTATTSTTPSTPSTGHTYIATITGTYTNFSNLVANVGDYLVYNGSVWQLVNGTSNLLIPSKNLLDKTAVSAGKYVNQNTGALVTDATQFTTDYVPITQNTDYHIYGNNSRYAFYNSGKTYISGQLVTAAYERTLTSPANAAYMKVSFLNTINNVSQLDIVQIETGTYFTGYETYGLKYKNYYKPKNTRNYNLENSPVLINELLTRSDNLFDRTGYWYGYVGNSGGLSADYTYYSSDYIPVTASSWYAFKNVYFMAWYNSSKTFISWGNIQADPTLIPDCFLKSPSNAAYMRISSKSLDMMTYKSDNKLKSIQNSTYTLNKNYVSLPFNSIRDVFDLKNVVPDTLWVVKGHEFSFYLDNFIFANVPLKTLDIDATCSLTSLKLYSSDTYSPAGDLGYYLRLDSATTAGLTQGNYPLTLNLYSYDKLVYQVRTNLYVVGSTWGSGITRKIMCVGESTTQNGTYVKELERMGSIDNFHLLGVGAFVTQGVHHEGVSGSQFSYHVTNAASPFVSGGVFNMHNFEATYATGLSSKDWIIFLGHINEGYDTTGIPYISQMIDSMRVVYPNVRFGVAYPIPPWGKDGVSYSALTGFRRNYKYDVLCQALKAHFGNKQSQKIYLIPIGCFDRFNGYPVSDLPLNWRMKTTTRKVSNNVHPTTQGYYLVADALFEFLKGEK